MKKYFVSYCSGATGYGWENEFDKLSDFEYLVDNIRKEYTQSLIVYDNELHDFIFWKDVLTYKPNIDKLHSFKRDMRTKNRIAKIYN